MNLYIPDIYVTTGGVTTPGHDLFTHMHRRCPRAYRTFARKGAVLGAKWHANVLDEVPLLRRWGCIDLHRGIGGGGQMGQHAHNSL